MEKHVKHGNAVHLGLCKGCDLSTGCSYPRDPGRPVLQCLELEERDVSRLAAVLGGRPLAARPVAARQSTEAQAARPGGRFTLGVSVETEGPRPERGLCADCELRASCTFPGSPGAARQGTEANAARPGGVWNCEEFR
jgi:hypothetical protein